MKSAIDVAEIGVKNERRIKAGMTEDMVNIT